MADTKITAVLPRGPEMFNEVATVQRDITFPAFLGRLINRDDTLIQRGQGKGLLIYDDIERDCHAYSVLQKRKLAVIARPWEVEAASKDALDQKAADLVAAQLKSINFDQLTVDLLDATLKGYAVGEVMWEANGAEVVAKKMIARDQRRFVFDDHYRLHMLTMENLVEGELMPERKFITHSFGAKDASPYGRGLGNRLFWPVLFKRMDITFWLTFADKFGSPTAVGTYPNGATVAEKRTLMNALQAIAQDTGITVPEGMVVTLLEAVRGGSIDTYEKLAKYLDDQMSEATLGETMTTSARGGGGLGQGGHAAVQNEVRLELVRADADLLSGVLNETLVRWIVEYNVPGAKPPKVYRKVEEPKDLSSQSTTDVNIASLGFRPSLQYINDTYAGDWTAAPQPTTPMPGRPAPGSPAGVKELLAQYADGAGVQLVNPILKSPVLGFPAQAAIDTAADKLPDATLQTQMERMLAPVLELARSGADYTAIMAQLAELFPTLDTASLEELLARAIFVGDLWGAVSADAESNAGI